MTAIPQGRARRTALVSAMCALVVTGTGLTGCSEDPDAGTNGVGKLTAAEIQAKTKQAAESAKTVRLAGTVLTDGTTYTLDMSLKDDGGTGSVTSKESTFRLLRVGEHLYLKADAEFWSDQGGSGGASSETDTAVADKLSGMYVKVPTDDPTYKQFSGFTDKDVLLDGLLTLQGDLSTDGYHEQSGTRTFRITGGDGSGGSLDVSLEGTAYPLLLVRAGNAGTLRLTDWGKDFALDEPSKKETVDYGQELPSS